MTDGATDRIRLGTILAPSGVLVVIDPGYASLWTHAEKDFARGGGCGEIQIHGVMTVVCGGVPVGRELAVYAEPIQAKLAPIDANETRWRKILVETDPAGHVVSSEKIGVTGVDWAGLMLMDADALACWGGDESPDGLAHGSRPRGFTMDRGDASFDVLAERDAAGQLVRLKLEEQVFDELRRCAIVTKSVLESGAPVAFLFREEPVGETDSGWVVTGGEDNEHFDDPDNVQLVRLRDLIYLHPGLEGLFGSSVGSAFARASDGKSFLPADFPNPTAI
jgi:hypothetical protein